MSATCYFYIKHTCTKTNVVQIYRIKKLRKKQSEKCSSIGKNYKGKNLLKL
jgi:hypothetical protein